MGTEVIDVLVVGGGPAGLTLARALTAGHPGLSVTVLEGAGRVGGKARTEIRDGYTFEHGPSDYTRNPEMVRLIEDSGLGDRVEVAPLRSLTRMAIVRDGRLLPTPRSPLGALTTPLLSPAAKARMLLEPLFARRPGPEGDESVHDMAARHFGAEVADRVVRNMLLGTAACDARTTSVRALAPALWDFERDAGRAGLLAHAVRSALRRRGGDRMRAPDVMHLVPGGVAALWERLATDLDGRVVTGAPAVSLEVDEDRRYAVTVTDGTRYVARTVVLAVPAYTAAALVAGMAPRAAEILRGITYSGLRVFGLGYRDDELARFPDGIGFLVPRGEGARMFAVAAVSRIVAAHAPDGHVLLRVFMGGSEDPGVFDLTRDEAVEEIRRDLRRFTGMTAEPGFVAEASDRRAIPRYEVGHAARLEQAEAALLEYPGLFLAGNSYRSLGLTATVLRAARLAPVVAERARRAARSERRPGPRGPARSRRGPSGTQHGPSETRSE
ncbi:protoporphyrinogen oxidase [Actinomadura darangshiensis]|uniref:Coproporphyrinogen III oxidase n=1 Tax=Actinomadura darangshiensis TaxID=705336 RepID=A0A4V2YXJ4_9ACTN|nr:protoporphyrinogen oxidase [Actinomadura darangshiensis]TDD89627.1 protoporphyrinogen oxidase [Actinomadura darangshiensis]